MKTTKPYYYDDFKCIADRCSDNCCIGWEIDIDPVTAEKYAQESGSLGDKLKKNIKDGSFILAQDERCPFLRSDNLCELICEKGEGYLCEICREHPRYYEFYGDYVDQGIGLCCEEACRLLFQSDKPVTFITEGEAQADEETEELLAERDVLLNEDRIEFCFDGLSDIWQRFEPFDRRWSDTTAYITQHLEYLISMTDEFMTHIGHRVYEYKHLRAYLLHRYYMRVLYGDDVIKGINIYLATQLLWDIYTYSVKGKFDLCDRIDTAKYLSKQIEYSEENINMLFEV